MLSDIVMTNNSMSGTVSLLDRSSEMYDSICATGFGSLESAVTCKELGFTNASVLKGAHHR